MAKFLNKKEQVIDFKLTSYGHYLLSNGDFKPMFYGFYDDNVIYDAKYININEAQNNINVRIKEETPYIESLVLFDEVEKSVNTLVEEVFTSEKPMEVISNASSYLADIRGNRWARATGGGKGTNNFSSLFE